MYALPQDFTPMHYSRGTVTGPCEKNSKTSFMFLKTYTGGWRISWQMPRSCQPDKWCRNPKVKACQDIYPGRKIILGWLVSLTIKKPKPCLFQILSQNLICLPLRIVSHMLLAGTQQHFHFLLWSPVHVRDWMNEKWIFHSSLPEGFQI